MPVQNFAHFGICVVDPERSMRFYRDILGFTPLSKLSAIDGSPAPAPRIRPETASSRSVSTSGPS